MSVVEATQSVLFCYGSTNSIVHVYNSVFHPSCQKPRVAQKFHEILLQISENT